MIKKYKDFINEGIRDKMTPKSNKEVRLAYLRYLIKDTRTWLADFGHKYTDEELFTDDIASFHFYNRLKDRLGKEGKGQDQVINFLLNTCEYKGEEETNEGLTDKMTPKSDEDIRNKIKNKSGYDKLRLSKQYGIELSNEEIKDSLLSIIDSDRGDIIFDLLKYKPDDLSNILSDKELNDLIKSYAKSLLKRIGGEGKELINELTKSLYYLFSERYFFDHVDRTGTIWFMNHDIGPYSGGHATFGKYNTFDDVKNYIERMKKLHNR